jgi:hypothetical protein
VGIFKKKPVRKKVRTRELPLLPKKEPPPPGSKTPLPQLPVPSGKTAKQARREARNRRAARRKKRREDKRKRMGQ